MAVMNASMIRTGSIASRVFAGVGLATIAGGLLSLKAAGDFEQAMNLLQAVAEPTTRQFQAMKKEAIDLGNDLRLPAVNAKDAADVMYDLSRSGLTVNQTMKATRGVLMMATAAHISFGDAALITARSLKAFNLDGSQAAKIADLIAAVANRTTASVQDMSDGFQNASGQFNSAGYSIQTLSVALAELVDKGLSGAQAGTALKVMLQRLESPTKKAQEVMDKLGISIFDAAGKIRPFPEIVDQFSKALANASDKTKAQALNTIFGQRANQAMIKLMEGGRVAWDNYTKKVTESGVAQQIADARMKGFNGALEKFKNAVSTLAIQLGTSLLPMFTDLVNASAKWIAGLDVNQIKSVFEGVKNSIVTMFNAVKPVFEFLINNPIGNSFVIMAASVYIMVRALGALRAAIVATKLAFSTFGAGMAGVSPMMIGVGLAASAAVGAFLLLSGALGSLHNQVVEIGSLQGAVNGLVTSLNGLQSSLNNLTNAHLSVKDAQIALQGSLITLHDASARWHKDLEDGTQKTRQGIADYFAYRSAEQQVAVSKQRLREAQGNLNTVMDKGQVTLKEAAANYRDVGGRAQQYLQQLASGDLTLEQYQSKTTDLNRKLKDSIQAHIELAAKLRNTNPAVSATQLKIAEYGMAIENIIKKHGRFTTKNIQAELKKIDVADVKKKMDKLVPDTQTVFDKVGSTIRSTGAGIANAARGVAANVVSGFVGTLAGGALAAYAAGVALGVAAIAGIRAGVGAHSDSVEAGKVGRDVASGFINGFVRYFKENEPKLKYPMLKAILSWKQLQPSFEEASKVLGSASAKAIAMGFLQATPTLVQQIKQAWREKMREVTQAAAQAVKDARSAFEQAFSDLASAALAAFDAKVAQWKNPIQTMIDNLNMADAIDQLKGVLGDKMMGLYDMIIASIKDGNLEAAEMMTESLLADINDAIAAAQSALDAAQINLTSILADPNATEEQKQAAQQALDDAKKKLQDLVDARMKVLQMIAEAEQTEHDKLMAKKRDNLQRELDQLRRELAKHPGEHAKNHAKIMALYKKYDIDYENAGREIGYSLAKGLRDSLAEVEKAAGELADAIAKKLRVKSPTEEGPMSDLDHWWDNFAKTLMSGLDTASINQTIEAMVTPPELGSVPNTTPNTVVNVPITLNVDKAIGNDLERAGRELADPVRREVMEIMRKNNY